MIAGMNEPALRQRAPTFAPRFVPRTPLERRLHGSLWTFRSPEWNGFVDFREPGVYFTHWGWGEWSTQPDNDRTIRMVNGYDGFYFVLTFDDDLTSFTCVSTNHTRNVPIAGDMIFDYTKMVPPSPAWKTAH